MLVTFRGRASPVADFARARWLFRAGAPRRSPLWHLAGRRTGHVPPLLDPDRGRCRADRCRAGGRAGHVGGCQRLRLDIEHFVHQSGGEHVGIRRRLSCAPGQTFPNPGTCRAGTLDSNHSESWIAVKPGTEDLGGSSKFFFENYSKFYDFYLGSYRILPGQPIGDNQVQGYDCVPDASELDGRDRPERRVRHQGTRLPDHAAVQRLLGRVDAASRRSDRRLLLRRHGPALGQGQRRAGPGAVSERLGQAGRSCRGEAVDRGQRHRRQPQPGPRLRDVVSLQ